MGGRKSRSQGKRNSVGEHILAWRFTEPQYTMNTIGYLMPHKQPEPPSHGDPRTYDSRSSVFHTNSVYICVCERER